MDPDAQLMVQFREGNDDAFDKLFEKYQRPVLNFCFRFLGNAHDAEDITQETFFQAYRAAGRYRPLTKFSTWLYTIAKNLCLNRLRANPIAGGAAGAGAQETQSADEVIHAEGPAPDEQAAGNEISEIIRRAIQELPPQLRLPLILRRYHDLSYEEIGRVADCSVTAVKLRLHRAKLILARRLGPYMKPGPG